MSTATPLTEGHAFTKCLYGLGKTQIPSIDRVNNYGLQGSGHVWTARGLHDDFYVVKSIKPKQLGFFKKLIDALGEFTPASFLASLEQKNEIFMYSRFVPDKKKCMDLYDLIKQKHEDHPIWIPHPELYWSILYCVHRMHSKGYVHRDVSIENIVVTCQPDGRWVVQIIDLEDSSPQCVEVDGVMSPNITYEVRVGKPMYMAPELMDVIIQESKYRPQLIPTDLWSLGCVFLVLLGVYWKPLDHIHQQLLKSGCDDSFLNEYLSCKMKKAIENSICLQNIVQVTKSLLQVNPQNRPSLDTILRRLSPISE